MTAVKYKFDASEQSNTAFQEIKDQLSKTFDHIVSNKGDHMLYEIRSGLNDIGSIKFYSATPGDSAQPGCIEFDSGTSRSKSSLEKMVRDIVTAHGGEQEALIDGPS